MTEPLALAGDERILITGASGWLGRSLLSILLPSIPADRLMALGSRGRTLTVEGRPIEILAWDGADVAGFAPTHIVHLAYLTRDRLAELGWSRYVAENVGLSARIVDLLALPSVRALVHTSSGAVAGLTESTAQPATVQPYGLLKRIDELLFADECARRGLACVTCRVWSVSGPHVVEPHKYAFSDLILQALSGSDRDRSLGESRVPALRRCGRADGRCAPTGSCRPLGGLRLGRDTHRDRRAGDGDRR